MLPEKLFDQLGRCSPELTSEEVIKKSRKYFYVDEAVREKLDDSEIFKNLKNYYNDQINIDYDEFIQRISKLRNKVEQDSSIKNIRNSINIPFILPIIKDHNDIGKDIDTLLIPKLIKSFKDKFPDYDFVNHCKVNLEGNISATKVSRYDQIIENLKTKNSVGILYLSLNEFSFQAAENVITKLPEYFYLTGPYELFSVLIGFPGLLLRNDKYPPLIWISSIKNNTNPNIGYVIEPYGYNLTFNKRPHFNQANEYWWHSLSIVD